MTPQDLAAFLNKSLDDHRLSRNERRTLTELAGQIGVDEQTAAECRKLAFQQARAVLFDPKSATVLEWLEEVLKTLQGKTASASGPSVGNASPPSEAFFSPGEECCRRLVSLLSSARRTLDICVFTITDDRLSGAILAAHRRSVKVRIITDDDKSTDLGSDIEELKRAGIPLRMDRSTFHMHHKFALVDGSLLLNGSFNWTRSASMNNQENFIITADPRLLAAFTKEFEKLWALFAD